jgi:UDP-3-O-acyl-N-acetylglucosamine deacetylase
MSGSAKRNTIGAVATLGGIGLHLGAQCSLTFRPAPSGQGVVFRRADRPGSAPVRPATSAHSSASGARCSGPGTTRSTPWSTCWPPWSRARSTTSRSSSTPAEPPILDGSARPFFDALAAAGVVANGASAEYLELSEPVRVIDGESVYEAFPASDLQLEVAIDFPHPLIGGNAVATL